MQLQAGCAHLAAPAIRTSVPNLRPGSNHVQGRPFTPSVGQEFPNIARAALALSLVALVARHGRRDQIVSHDRSREHRSARDEG